MKNQRVSVLINFIGATDLSERYVKDSVGSGMMDKQVGFFVVYYTERFSSDGEPRPLKHLHSFTTQTGVLVQNENLTQRNNH